MEIGKEVETIVIEPVEPPVPIAEPDSPPKAPIPA